MNITETIMDAEVVYEQFAHHTSFVDKDYRDISDSDFNHFLDEARAHVEGIEPLHNNLVGSYLVKEK